MTLLKITSIEVAPFEYSYSVPFQNSQNVWQKKRGFQIRLWDQSGFYGDGEASSLEGYSAFSHEDIDWELQKLTVHDIPCMHIDTQMESELFRFSAKLSISLPCMRFAIETAMLDLVGKHTGLPISRLFEPSPCHIPLSTLLQESEDCFVLEEAQAAFQRGIRTLKYKIGKAGIWQKELRTVQLLRSSFEKTVSLRFDANQAWTDLEAKECLKELAVYQPEFVEEPTQAGKMLAKQAVPIAYDESLQDPSIRLHLAQSLSNGDCQVLVLKPTILGGFSECLKLAQLARNHNVGILVTHCLEGPIGLSAAAELALALSRFQGILPCGLDWPPLGRASPFSRPPQLSEDKICPTNLDEDKMGRVFR